MKIKNNIITIMKKECSRIINDKKLLFMAVLMPGLLIYVMYTLMGGLMGNMFSVDEDYMYQVNVLNMPQSSAVFMPSPESLKIKITSISENDVAKIKQQIENRETDLLLIFPQDFDEQVAAYDAVTSDAPAPNIQIWANTARTESSEVNNLVTGILNGYHYDLTHKFTINAPVVDAETEELISYDLMTDADLFAMVMGSLVPMLFIIFLFQGCQVLAPESIAGEKERGTLGALLVTPTKRSDMAFAKILSISIFSLLGAVGSMIGMGLSLPSMMQMETGNILDFYSMQDLLLLFLVAITTTLVFVSLLSVMSAYAKSVKEANAYAMPVMLISMVCGLASMMMGGVPSDIYYYLIPVFNSALCITSVVNKDIAALNIIITVAVNLAFTFICTGVLSKIFSSEKIVFDK